MDLLLDVQLEGRKELWLSGLSYQYRQYLIVRGIVNSFAFLILGSYVLLIFTCPPAWGLADMRCGHADEGQSGNTSGLYPLLACTKT